jgi:hypothetical protein
MQYEACVGVSDCWGRNVNKIPELAQCRVGPRCGRYGSIYQGLMSYFHVANVSFSYFYQGYSRVGKGHVGRKWDTNVL